MMLENSCRDIGVSFFLVVLTQRYFDARQGVSITTYYDIQNPFWDDIKPLLNILLAFEALLHISFFNQANSNWGRRALYVVSFCSKYCHVFKGREAAKAARDFTHYNNLAIWRLISRHVWKFQNNFKWWPFIVGYLQKQNWWFGTRF